MQSENREFNASGDMELIRYSTKRALCRKLCRAPLQHR